MRLLWILPVGFFFAVFVLTLTSPLLVLTGGVVTHFLRDDVFSALSGESVFGVRNLDGRLDGRMVNVGFHTVWIRDGQDNTPHRLLVRLEVSNADVFATRTDEGRIRFDAWPMENAADLLRSPLYSVIASGRTATIEEGTVQIDHGSRHSIYSLTDGKWLYDYDVPPVIMNVDNDRRRVVAISTADADMVPGGIAVLTFASDRKVIRRFAIAVQEAARARVLRSAMTMIHPLIRTEESNRRTIELVLSAGLVRLPLLVLGDDLDLSQAQLPPGLELIELRPWAK